MKKLLIVFLIGILICVFVGCTTTKYVEVPVPQVKIEYRDRTSIDTLVMNDSVFIHEKGDTVIFEKYKYLYRVKEIKDTINIVDTITVVKTVDVIKEVNRIHNWQIILMVLGGMFIPFSIYTIIKIFKT